MASGKIKRETKDGNSKIMMKSDQHTDSIFKNLEQLEVLPSDKIWADIESRLDKKKQRLIPVFWGWGAAASILLLVGLFLLVPDELMNNQDRPVVSNTSPATKASETNEIVPLNESGQTEEFIQQLSENIQHIKEELIVDAESDVTTNDSPVSSALPAIAEKENELIAKTSEEESNEELQKINSLSEVRLALVTVQPEVHDLKSQSEKKEYPRFTVPGEQASEKTTVGITLGGEYSPTYAYRDVSGVASGVNESGLMTSGGGVNLAVKMNSRWQIETGVKYAMLGQEVNPKSSPRNVYSTGDFSAESSVSLQEVQLTNSLGAIERDASPALNSDVREFQNAYNAVVEMKASSPSYEGSTVLEQNLSYLQVPFTLRYQLLQQGPVQLSLAGGIGANWLVDNNAYLEMSGQRQRIGQTGGISGLSFSTHAGVAVSVPLYRGLGIKMEPRINYFISNISEDGPEKFRPYSVGVFTGLFYQW
jgi:hypothetical protein